MGSKVFDYFAIPDDGYFLYSNLFQHPIFFKIMISGFYRVIADSGYSLVDYITR